MEKGQKKTLVLLDTHAILHRAYHALPDFSSSKGEPTGAIYGLCTMLFKIIGDIRPDYVVACYDLPGKTYRHEAYDQYKAGRKKVDDALVIQMKRSRDVFDVFGIPIYQKEGFEADDMLGTIVELLKKDKNTDIVIASGDMDTLQLVRGKSVRVYTLKKGIKDTIIYDEKAVEERYGFSPKQLTDYKGLRGDPSDNIIGIKGIGEVTATSLIKTFGTIEEMYAALKKNKKAFEKAGIKPRIIELLEQGEEEAKFSKMLATIRPDAPIEFSLPEKSWKELVHPEKVQKLFAELEFRTLSARLKELIGGSKGDVFAEVPVMQKAPSGDVFDSHEEDSSVDQSDKAESDPVSAEEINRTGIALWVLNSTITHSSLEDILSYAKTQNYTKAKEYIFTELKRTGLDKVFDRLEEPVIPIIKRMGERGVKVDAKYLAGLSKEYHAEVAGVEKEIWKLAGEEFNVASPKQLGVILFDKLQLDTKGLKKTAGGARSTKESELEKLVEAHPIVPLVMKYREVTKLLSTYIDPIPTMLDQGGRLHARFLQDGTTTGRMSSEQPNLQNIPVKGEQGRKIRNAFIADKGYKLAAFDYSQIELRVAAFLSGDEKLITIFKNGEDVHTSVAAYVFKVPMDQVDKEMRRRAKVINFGILYGMGVNALRVNLGTDRKEAQRFYNEYFETFSTLAKYLEDVKKETTKTGFTETFFGRRRYFEGMKSSIPFIRAAAERMAINAPIQGTGADMVKLAMVAIEKMIHEGGLLDKVYPILQVHDELVYEIHESCVDLIIPKIRKAMESVVTLEETKGVPILATAKVGDNWGVMIDIADKK